MLVSNHQTRFSLAIANLKRDYKLQVLQFKGQEGLTLPYCFDIELVIDRHELDLDDYLHKPAYLCIDEQEGYGFHGLIHQFVQGETSLDLTHYHLKLVPQLFYLEHRTNQRIFQKLTVQQIIEQVLGEHGILSDRYRFELDTRGYEPRDHCTQYKESDLHFVQRLCEEEGIAYRFEHERESHTLVFSDHQDRFKRLPKTTPFQPDNGMNPETVAVKVFSVGIKGKTSRVTRYHHDFETTHRTLQADFRGYEEETWKRQQELEDFAFPAHFKTKAHGDQLASRALERLQLQAHMAWGESDQPMLLSGHLFALEGHLREEWNAYWLLNEISHTGEQPQVMEAFRGKAKESKDGLGQHYHNRFSATPALTVYRPPIQHPKPQLLASQTAIVCGPKGEEIYCDEYGRVKVRFRWDRSGSADEVSSRWVRVASGWAGNGYGSLVIPRVGMEVVVTFEEGNPDAPLITGCVFNKANTVPYPLPANKTRSVFKTLSYPGGGGEGNELQIEDRKGSERIYLNAQRDFQHHVRNDHTLDVDNEQHTTIKANAYSEYHAEEHHTTHGLRTTQLNADDSLNIAGSSYTQVAETMVIRTGSQSHLQAGKDMTLNGGEQVALTSGGHYLIVSPAGIFCSSPIILGGAPRPGPPPAIQHPRLPGETDAQAAGRMMALPLSLPEFAWEHALAPVEVLPDAVVCKNCLRRSQDAATSLLTRRPQPAQLV